MKKKIAATVGLVILAALLAGGSIAYFTSNDSGIMQFMATTYDPDNPKGYDDPDEVFSIVVDEQDVNDPDYNPEHPETNPRTEEGNKYEDMQPGDLYVKDPTVHNTGKYGQYIRMRLYVSEGTGWNTACGKYGLPSLDFNTVPLFLEGFNADFANGAEINYDADTDTYEFIYYLNHILEPGDSETLFEGVRIPAEFNREEALLIQNFNVNVTAEAIQSDNLNLENIKMDEDSAYEAFKKYWPEET